MINNSIVIVTGAGGLVGNAICNDLYSRKVNFIAIYKTQPIQIPEFAFILKNLEFELLNDIIKNKKISHIIHTAANLPQNSIESSAISATKNILIDDNIIKSTLNNNIKIIYISGTSVYSNNKLQSINETYKVSNTLAPYIYQKYQTEEKLIKLNAGHVIMRISSPYNKNLIRKNVLSIFIENAINNINIQYYGLGLRQQDFIHTTDISNAIYEIINKNVQQTTYNIASGKPISMKNLAEMIVKILPNCTSIIQSFGIEDPQENYKALFDITKAKNELKWQPEITLEEGIKDWIRYRLQK